MTGMFLPTSFAESPRSSGFEIRLLGRMVAKILENPTLFLGEALLRAGRCVLGRGYHTNSRNTSTNVCYSGYSELIQRSDDGVPV